MMHWQFPHTRRTGSPIAQVAAGVVSVVVIATLGLFALGAAAVIVVGLVIALAVRRLLAGQSVKPAANFQPGARIDTRANGNVIDGEYVVVESAPVDESREGADVAR